MLDVILFTRSYYIIAINTEIASQLYYVLLIFALATLFGAVSRNIESVIPEEDSKSLRTGETSQVLLKQVKSVRALQNLTHDLNDTFGLLILLNCIRDIICVIGVIASLLEVIGPRGANETDVAYAERLEGTARQASWDYTTISISLSNAALRIGVCLHCASQVKKIVRLVQAVRAEYRELDIQASCALMLSEIDSSTGAISAAGIRTIDLEYLAYVRLKPFCT
ncbi:hypothetical protein RvY_12298 [Ramazzottius varieornatus]|uniref:Gustatory receptor n=1 Tax=Ramazzottius varieornatus TaxID=947166 RepID=A0A1D1VJ18_RAMVA|nr:hypothetical protein RvY_12298 [Ramazzottius varieornatus]